MTDRQIGRETRRQIDRQKDAKRPVSLKMQRSFVHAENVLI